MSSDPNASHVTSQIGRQWLQATNSQSCLESPTEEEPLVVAFPDVSDQVDHTNGAFDDPSVNSDELAAALSLANQNRPLNGTPQLDSTPTNSLGIVGHYEDVDEAAPARADIAEPSTDWTEKPAKPETPRAEPGSQPSKQPKPEVSITNAIADSDAIVDSDTTASKPINSLTNTIIERFPLGDPTVLTFVGSETNLHIDETCARIASELAGRRIGRILLVDADFDGKSLSRASGIEQQSGLTDIINKSLAWESMIYGRSATGLDFLGAGTGSFTHEEAESRLRHVVADLKKEYQFICVAAGDAHSLSAKLWNDISDGSYLLVSIKNSNESYAKSAVAEMRSCGARLLGCVVTDVE